MFDEQELRDLVGAVSHVWGLFGGPPRLEALYDKLQNALLQIELEDTK